MPTKLTQLRYSGYSAEFLDRVEPNGNIPGKNGTAGIAGMYVLKLYVKRTDTAVLELTAKKRFSDSPPVKLFFPFPSFVQSQKVSSAGTMGLKRCGNTAQ